MVTGNLNINSLSNNLKLIRKGKVDVLAMTKTKIQTFTLNQFSSIHLGDIGTIWTKKTAPVKNEQTHSFFLLTHNFHNKNE